MPPSNIHEHFWWSCEHHRGYSRELNAVDGMDEEWFVAYGMLRWERISFMAGLDYERSLAPKNVIFGEVEVY